MTDFATVGWAMATAIWVAVAVYAYWLVGLVWKDSLMRCPETGSITLVGIEPASRRAGTAPGVIVRRCGLWPGKIDCARGCLARFGEISPGYRVNVHALRPFEERQRAASSGSP